MSSLNQTEDQKKLGDVNSSSLEDEVEASADSGHKKIREVQTRVQLASRRPETPADAMLGITDNLTGLYSGDYLESKLSEEMTRAYWGDRRS